MITEIYPHIQYEMDFDIQDSLQHVAEHIVKPDEDPATKQYPRPTPITTRATFEEIEDLLLEWAQKTLPAQAEGGEGEEDDLEQLQGQFGEDGGQIGDDSGLGDPDNSQLDQTYENPDENPDEVDPD